jgi:hypothetical protein
MQGKDINRATKEVNSSFLDKKKERQTRSSLKTPTPMGTTERDNVDAPFFVF